MSARGKVMERVRALRCDWRLWLQPRSVATMIVVVGVLFLAFGTTVLAPAREGLPALSRQPVRLFTGTVAKAREVFSGSGDEAEASTELLTTAGTGAVPVPEEPLRASDPVATLGDRDEPLTVAEVRRLVEDDPARARDLVFLPGVSVGQATVILDRPPTATQVPTRPTRPSTTTTTGSSSTTTTTRPRPPRTPPTQPPSTAPDPTDPGPTVPDPTVPDPTVPDPTVPDPTVPDPTVPDPTVPDPTVPDPTVPDPTVPDPTVPDPTVPDPTVPDTTEPPVDPPIIELPDIELPDLLDLDLLGLG